MMGKKFLLVISGLRSLSMYADSGGLGGLFCSLLVSRLLGTAFTPLAQWISASEGKAKETLLRPSSHPSILLVAAISDDWGAYRSLIGQSVSGAWCEKTGGSERKAREVNKGLRITWIRLGSEANEGQVLALTTRNPRLPGYYQEGYIGS